MAVKVLNAQAAAKEGTLLTFHDSTAATPVATRLTTGTLTSGDQFQVGKGAVLVVENGATDCNVTIQTARTIDGLALADRVIAVAANTKRMVDIDGEAYGPEVLFAMDSVTNVEIAVVR